MKVEVVNVQIESTAFLSARARVSIDVTNPNSTTITVDSVTYELELNGNSVIQGVYDTPVILKAKEKTPVSIPVEIEYMKVFQSISKLAQFPPGSEISYRAHGVAKSGLIHVPFEHKGSLTLPK